MGPHLNHVGAAEKPEKIPPAVWNAIMVGILVPSALCVARVADVLKSPTAIVQPQEDKPIAAEVTPEENDPDITEVAQSRLP
jgi:hypothetical protein